MSSRRSGRTSGAARDSPEDTLTVKVPSSRSRQGTRGGNRPEQFEGGEIVHGKRNRGAKKSYVVDSSPDDDDDDEEEDAEIDDDEDDDMDDVGDEDAEGEDELIVGGRQVDVDADGDEDAEGDIDMDAGSRPAGPTIRVSQPSRSKPAPRASASKVVMDEDDDDDSLSDPDDSEGEDQTMGLGDETMGDDDEDAEGEEIEVAGDEDDEEDEDEEDAEGEEIDVGGRARGQGDELDSDEIGSREVSPDVAKMTKRQRARFEDEPQEYMKLSDEVQVKKHFTAEELSMRRQEMARRRRNLSDKRNEEVKMETINKLLKKQAPKINRKAAAAAANAELAAEEDRAGSIFVRWVSKKDGSQVSVPEDMFAGPAGKVFGGGNGGLASGKMVEEVS